MVDPRDKNGRVPGSKRTAEARPQARRSGSPPSADLMSRRALLDEALMGLRAIKDPKIPLRAMERHLVASLGGLYGALVAPAEAQRFQEGTATALSRALAALSSLESAGSQDPAALRIAEQLREATEGWKEAAGRTVLHSLSLPQPAKGEWPRASSHVPSLITMERAPLQPAIVLPVEEGAELTEEPATPETLPPVDSLDALLAQAEAQGAALDGPLDEVPLVPAGPGPAKALLTVEEAERERLGTSLMREEVELSRARAFFEELAMMGLMRQPDPGDLWSELRPVEERLLARVDGILACGEWVVPELVKLLDDRPVPDPELTWAALFVPGCLAGDDALHQVVRVLRTAGLQELEVFDAACDALTFVPHPGLEPLLREWLVSEELLHRVMAVRVLGRRGLLRGEEALAFAREGELRLALEGARALPWVQGELDLRETARLLWHKHEEIVACAIEALWVRRSPAGFEHARALVVEGKEDFAEAALWLAIGGGATVRADFEAATARGAASPTLLEALGWYGDLRFVDFLLEQLQAGQVAAVGALQRLTGASLTDDEPDPEYSKGEEPFTPGFELPLDELELTADPEVWAEWWKKHQGRATLTKRYRWGHLWSTQDNLWELEEAPASPRERRRAFHELVVRTGVIHPFDPRDFVARQEAAIARWREAPELRRAASGTWSSPFSR